MALDKYRQKRDFSESPEPAGDPGLAASRARRTRRKAPLFFCVQKHLASHLHYDLRLEHGGVLLSWAVPKGPSLDPTIRRLAMHVEDHPIEYGDFEGVIPSGYGAGIVMLWDYGSWTPDVDDVDAALRKGDLKFTLDGYKLKGSWALVRTKGGAWGGGGDGRSWLLIKHRDDWAGPIDIAEFAPLSVKSEGDFADILAQGNPDIWRSNKPARSGETGAMFDRIVARALEMHAGGATGRKHTRGGKKTATKGTGAAARASHRSSGPAARTGSKGPPASRAKSRGKSAGKTATTPARPARTPRKRTRR
jgi:bifunctional non-homologous end joining protein LigD